MLERVKTAVREMTAAFARIMVIFAVLVLFFDSMTRLFYSYMPIETWIDFRRVEVVNVRGEAYVVLERVPVGRQIAMFHRSLIIRYPENERGCTASLMVVLDNPSDATITVPLKRLVAPTCPDVLAGRRIEGQLQVSYIFEFPFGVKRTATRYSTSFSLQFEDGKFVSGPPLGMREDAF